MVTDALITNEIDPDIQLWIDYMSRLSFINRIIDIMAIALIITNIILLIQLLKKTKRNSIITFVIVLIIFSIIYYIGKRVLTSGFGLFDSSFDILDDFTKPLILNAIPLLINIIIIIYLIIKLKKEGKLKCQE